MNIQSSLCDQSLFIIFKLPLANFYMTTLGEVDHCNHSTADQLKKRIKNSNKMLWGKVDHLLIRISNPWSTLPHLLISSLRRVFGKCFRNNDSCCCRFLSLCNCRQSTVINLIFGCIHRENFDISVAPKLEGKCKIPHFFAIDRKLAP